VSQVQQDETMKRKRLKNRKPLANSIRVDLWHALDDLAKRTRLNKSVLLDEAIEMLLEKYKEKIEEK